MFNRTGYQVLKNVFSKGECEKLLSGYNNQPSAGNNNYLYAKKCDLKSLDFIQDKLDNITDQIDLDIDHLFEGWYWPTNIGSGVSFNWHQDHETYFLTEQHSNYLNVYIVIDKERKQDSNLSVIPFDKLSNNSRSRLIGQGANIFWKAQNMKDRLNSIGDFDDTFGTCAGKLDLYYDRYVQRNDMDNYVTPMDENLDHISETPHLQIGDVLLLRGDVIHKTSDSRCRRVALSLRYVNKSETKVSQLYNRMTSQKAKMMLRNKSWLWILAYLSAKNIKTVSMVEHKKLWEQQEVGKLTCFETLKSYFYYSYHYLKLKSINTKFTFIE
jgi:hypothetical protein